MIGRAVFGNPWLFAEKRPCQEPAKPVTALQVYFLFFLNTQSYLKKINKGKKFDVMKKHFKSYVCDFPRQRIADKTDGRQKHKRSGENYKGLSPPIGCYSK